MEVQEPVPGYDEVIKAEPVSPGWIIKHRNTGIVFVGGQGKTVMLSDTLVKVSELLTLAYRNAGHEDLAVQVQKDLDDHINCDCDVFTLVPVVEDGEGWLSWAWPVAAINAPGDLPPSLSALLAAGKTWADAIRGWPDLIPMATDLIKAVDAAEAEFG